MVVEEVVLDQDQLPTQMLQELMERLTLVVAVVEENLYVLLLDQVELMVPLELEAQV